MLINLYLISTRIITTTYFDYLYLKNQKINIIYTEIRVSCSIKSRSSSALILCSLCRKSTGIFP